MLDPTNMTLILITFFLAGMVKGVIGLGLPTVSLGILTASLDLPTAMALLLVPSFMTNLWQAGTGGHGIEILRRIWPFLIMATSSVWIGSLIFVRVDLVLLSALLGLLIIAYAVISFAGLRACLTPRQEKRVGPLLGALNGILTGMTGAFVFPGVLYLQAIGLKRDQLIQAMGILFALSTVALAITLKNNEFLTLKLGLLSFTGLIPALVGMLLGQVIRKKLSEKLFRKIFFTSLFLLGTYIIFNAINAAI